MHIWNSQASKHIKKQKTEQLHGRMEVRIPQKTKVNVPEPKALKLTIIFKKTKKQCINPIHIISFKMNLLYLKKFTLCCSSPKKN